MNKFELLAEISQANEELETVLVPLTAEDWTEPGPGGDWSVKDNLAHITAWMKLVTDWLQKSLNGESVTRYLPGYVLTGKDEEDEATMHRLNDHFYETHKTLPTETIVEQYRQACEGLTAVVATMLESDLFEAGRFDWYPDQPVWLNIAGNSFWHIRDHLADLGKTG